MKIRRLLIIIIALLLCASLAGVPLAFAAEDIPETKTMGEDGNLTVVQSYPATNSAPSMPNTTTYGGQSFSLDKATTAPDPGYVKPRQYFTGQAYNQVPLSGAGNWAAYFPAAYPIDEGEFQGYIGLDPYNPFYVTERYHLYLVQVDKQVVVPNLPDNDVSRLPVYRDFEVVSSSTPGATMISTLKIVDVSYEVAGRDHLGLPNNYTAYVTYRGQEGLHELEFYDVTANYSGEIESSIDQMTITGVYKPDVVEAAPTVIAAPDVPLAPAPPSLPLFPLVVASTMVAVFLATPLLYFFLLSNARLIRVVRPEEEEDDEEGIKKRRKEKTTTKLICRRRLVLREGVARFTIPSNINIFDGELYNLAIKPTFASREGTVEMLWQGRRVAAMPLARYIDVNFTEMLTTSTEAVLMELGLLD